MLASTEAVATIAVHDAGKAKAFYHDKLGLEILDEREGVTTYQSGGAKLFVCAFGCQKRRIPLRDSEKLTYCGLVVLTDIINGTDRFVALN